MFKIKDRKNALYTLLGTVSFNRTNSGIETFIGLLKKQTMGTFNRTNSGIETKERGRAQTTLQSFNRTNSGIETNLRVLRRQ